jgi:hypothetical protein
VPLSFPRSPVDKVYYPRVCNCADYPTSHYHESQPRVYPTPVEGHPFEPPEANSLEPDTDVASASPKPNQPVTATQVDILKQLASLLHLDGHSTDNSGGLEVMNPEIAEDARWTDCMAHLPLELGKGYLPGEQPILVPTRLEVMTNGQCPGYIEDTDGPPRASRHYRSWSRETAMSEKIKNTTALNHGDYETVSDAIQRTIPTDGPGGAHYAENSDFLLPLEWRVRLYNGLFCPIKFEAQNGRVPDPFIEAVIESKVLAIRYIEGFLLRVWVELGVEPFPSLKHFVLDFFVLSEILKERIETKKIPTNIRYDQVTLWTSTTSAFGQSWLERFENMGVWGTVIGNSESIRRHYVCALFDVMFGIWQAPGRCLFHDGWLGERANVITNTEEPWNTSRWVSAESTVPRCIRKGLYFWEEPSPLPDTVTEINEEADMYKEARISLAYLDACFIEYRGPYRFKRANHLKDHLTVIAHGSHKEILVYTDWKRLLMLRHHQVLLHDAKAKSEDVSKLQLLSRSRKSPKDRRNGKGGDIRYIAYELLRTYELLFWRGVSERTADGHGYLYHHTHTWDMRFFTKSSEEIAIDTLGMNDLLEVKKEIISMFSSPEFRLPDSSGFNIFRLKLEGLNRELMEWRPRTVWHALWYEGYSQDATSVWTNLITVYLVPITLFGFIASLVQAIYGALSYDKG